MSIALLHSFTDDLPADPVKFNMPRQVTGACFSYVNPKGMEHPELVIHSAEVAHDLKFSREFCLSQEFCDIMTGNIIAEGSTPYAMCYGGHQFGNWAGQLGDGRAINLGEVPVPAGRHLNLQLKGSGPTPYSRSADGLAVLRSSVREFLCSEAMFHLGVPTTRALSLTLTGEKVLRDMMYDGNAAYEKGAVVCRVAPSFIRFGNFEIFASRQDHNTLRKITDYTISHYFPNLQNDKDKYLHFFREVAERTCTMILHWQRVGFVHGVMNTDNMSVLGLTIDYGPYGWIDDYDPAWTPNTTDLPGKRYRFGNQPVIGQWNLLKLANALFPLIKEEDGLKNIIEAYRVQYTAGYHTMMKEKMGIYEDEAGDKELIETLEKLLVATETDMTIFFRQMAKIYTYTTTDDGLDVFKEAYYNDHLTDSYKEQFEVWLSNYTQRMKKEKVSVEDRITKMNAVNPKYVLRNYMAQLAIDNADNKDYALIHELYQMLKNPYAEQQEFNRWYAKRPDWAKQKVGCSMLSCSS